MDRAAAQSLRRSGFIAFAAALCVASTAPAAGAIERSRTAVAEFKRQQPCPSTGRSRGPCPGWIVDHITPLCAGGVDRPENMQWQTVAEAKIKDRQERIQCRRRPS